MPFKKGSLGRPVGTKNTKTKQWEALSESIVGKHSEEFNNYMNELWSGSQSDKQKASDLFLQVLKYFKPKMSSVEASVQDNDNTISFIMFKDA